MVPGLEDLVLEVLASEVPASEALALDVPALEVPVSEVPVSEVPASEVLVLDVANLASLAATTRMRPRYRSREHTNNKPHSVKFLLQLVQRTMCSPAKRLSSQFHVGTAHIDELADR